MTPLRNLPVTERGKCVASSNPPTAVHRVPRHVPVRQTKQPLQQAACVPHATSTRILQACRILAQAASTEVAPMVTEGIPQPTPPPEPKVAIEGVVCLPVVAGIKCLRGVCNERLKYEVEYSLKKGTSENSYLLSGKNGQKYNVLIDVPYKAFSDAFLPALRAEVPLNELSHIIITHLGPNRFPTLKAVLEEALQGRPAGSPLKLVVTNPAKSALQKGLAEVLSAAGAAVEFVIPKEGSILITDKYSLTAVLTPTPRWPDAMCIIDPASKVVFTSKFFSAHVAPGLLNSKANSSAFDVGAWETYGDHWRYFFDCMLAPMATQAQSALEKLPVTATPRASMDTPANFMSSVMKSWTAMVADITAGSREPAKTSGKPSAARLFAYALAPQHGPVIRTSLSHLAAEYRKWTQDQIAASKTSNVVVMYASAYGNTAALAQAISRGVVKSGVAVNTVNLEVTPLDDVVAAVKASDGFTIGSPTLGGHMPTPVQLALGSILRSGGARELPCGVFGSFGWSGEAVDEMESKLEDGGYGFAFKPIKVKFKPTTKDLSTCEQSGRDLAVQVKRRLKNKEQGSMGSMAAVTASGPQLAMGRVVGSLCVITAKDEDYATGMIASWVSQASFDPPGITVSVKKDRTLETMLQPGNPFAVSMVTESQAKRVRKTMSTPFTPGADRLASLKTHPSPVSATPVLDTSNAILDCTVVSRMEAGDHWIVYGQVDDGVLQNDKELTAVMHRKVGNHY